MAHSSRTLHEEGEKPPWDHHPHLEDHHAEGLEEEELSMCTVAYLVSRFGLRRS